MSRGAPSLVPAKMADSEKHIPARDVSALLRERLGRSFHLKTIGRWMRTGVAGPDGARIRLPSLRVGRTRYVSEAGLESFCEQLTRAWTIADRAPPPNRSKRSSGRDSSKLDKLGF